MYNKSHELDGLDELAHKKGVKKSASIYKLGEVVGEMLCFIPLLLWVESLKVWLSNG